MTDNVIPFPRKHMRDVDMLEDGLRSELLKIPLSDLNEDNVYNVLKNYLETQGIFSFTILEVTI